MPNESDLEALLRAQRAAGFAPGFADRVMTRVATERVATERVSRERVTRERAVVDVSSALARQFVRLVPAALAASLALAAVNWWRARDTAASPAELLAAAIGVPNVTVASALVLSPTDSSTPADQP